jgi:Ca2+-binding RTX toxin-like protein
MLFLLSLFGASAFAGVMGAAAGRTEDGGAEDDATPDDKGSTNTTADAAARTSGDFIRGTDRADTLAGDDTDIIRARGGADTITLSDSATGYGETGRDKITLSDTATAYGGFGNDTLSVLGASAGATGGTAYGGNGNDEISVIDSATASGDAGNDFITWYASAAAPSGHDIQLSGGQGNDTLSAWSQTDGQVTLAGGTGRDLLVAGDGVLARGSFGADTLVGANGAVLTGGQGADRFVASPTQAFSTSDEAVTITDFAKGRDSISVHLVEPPSNIALNESDGDTRLTLDWQVSDTETDSMTVLVRGVTGLTLDDFDFVTEAGITATPGIGFDFQTSAPLDSVTRGTPGADQLTAANGDIIVATGAGADSVAAGAGTTGGVINLGDGNDTYTATGARADLVTGAGNDTVDYTTGPDPADTTSSFFSFETGAGNDTVTINAPALPPSTTGVQLQVDLGSGNDSLIIDKDVTNPIFAFDDSGDDNLTMWMGHSVNMQGTGNDVLTIGIDGDHIGTRSATEVYELTPADRVIIEVEAGITGPIQFAQIPGTGDDPAKTAIQIGGKTVVTFNALIAANDPRITITRDAVFA